MEPIINQGRKKEEKNIIQYDGIAPTPQRHTNTLTVDRSKAIKFSDTEATINDGHGDHGDDDKGGDGDRIINEIARRQQSTADTEITETLITRER